MTLLVSLYFTKVKELVFLTAGAAQPSTIQTSDVTSPLGSVTNDLDNEGTGPPPPTRQRTEPSSPLSQSSRLFSPPSANALSSEIDLSSPLTYGTPSSRIGGPGSNRG